MKKIVLIGRAVLGIAVLGFAVVNVNLSNKSSNMSGVALKNYEALTQEILPPPLPPPDYPMKYLAWNMTCYSHPNIRIDYCTELGHVSGGTQYCTPKPCPKH